MKLTAQILPFKSAPKLDINSLGSLREYIDAVRDLIESRKQLYDASREAIRMENEAKDRVREIDAEINKTHRLQNSLERKGLEKILIQIKKKLEANFENVSYKLNRTNTIEGKFESDIYYRISFGVDWENGEYHIELTLNYDTESLTRVWGEKFEVDELIEELKKFRERIS